MKSIHAYVGGAFITGVMFALTAVFSSSAAFAASPSPSVYLTPLALNWSKDGKSIIIQAKAKASVPATYRLPDDMTAMLVVERGDARGKSYRAPISLSSGKSERSGRVSIAVDGDHLTAAPAAHIFISAVFAWKTKILKPMACYGLRQQGTSCGQLYKSHTARAGTSVEMPSGRPAVKVDAPAAQASAGGSIDSNSTIRPRLAISNFRATTDVVKFLATLNQVAYHLKSDEVLMHKGTPFQLKRITPRTDSIHTYVANVTVSLDAIGSSLQVLSFSTHRDAWKGVEAMFSKYGTEADHLARLAPAPQPEEPEASIDIPTEPMAMASAGVASGGGFEGGEAGIDSAQVGAIKHTPNQLSSAGKMQLLVYLDPPFTGTGTLRIQASGGDLSFTNKTLEFVNGDDGFEALEVEYVGRKKSPGEMIAYVNLKVHKDDIGVYDADRLSVPVYQPSPEAFCIPSESGACLHSDIKMVSTKVSAGARWQDNMDADGNSKHSIDPHSFKIKVGGGYETTLTYRCLAEAGKECKQFKQFPILICQVTGGYQWVDPNKTIESDLDGKTFILKGNANQETGECMGWSTQPYMLRAITTRSAS